MNCADCYEPHPEHAAGEIIDGEAVVINLATGVYYSLNGVAGEIWRMVADRTSTASMVIALVASYDVERAVAERDLQGVLRQLVDEGLVRETIAGAAHAHLNRPVTRAPYVPPAVEIYRDMQDLLALDPPSPGLNGVIWKRPLDTE